jgi:hypothetical protein
VDAEGTRRLAGHSRYYVDTEGATRRSLEIRANPSCGRRGHEARGIRVDLSCGRRGHEACEAIRRSLEIWTDSFCRRRGHESTRRVKFGWIYHVDAEGVRCVSSHSKTERIHSVNAESTRRLASHLKFGRIRSVDAEDMSPRGV